MKIKREDFLWKVRLKFIIQGNNVANTVDVFLTIEIISQLDTWQETIAVTDLQHIKQIEI